MRWIREEIVTNAYPEGLVCVADHQTAGRGRDTGRVWLDRPAEALLTTVALPVPSVDMGPPGAVSLRTGLGIARVVERYAAGVTVKWPNDVLIREKKCAGILLEKNREWIFIGFGVNLLQKAFPPEIAGRATSLLLESGKPPEREDLLDEILDSLSLSYRDERWREEIEHRLTWRGRRVTFSAAEFPQKVTGVIDGIEEDGALRVRRLSSTMLTTILPDPWLCYSGEILWNE